MKKNTIPFKNYLLTFLACFLTIFLVFIIFFSLKTIQNKQIQTSYLISSKTITKEIKDFTSEKNSLPNEYFLFISYRNDKNVYKLEKDLKPIIDKYKLNDLFYYYDITNLKEDTNYLSTLNNTLNLTEIKNIPTIIYVKDNKVLKDAIINREDNQMINASDFEKLLQMFELNKVK